MFLFPIRGKANRKDSESEELKKLYHQILSYCRKNLIDAGSAEECTQDVFSVYFEKAAQIKIRNPRAWLFRTADNYLHKYNQKFQQEKQSIFPLPNLEDDAEDMEDIRFAYEQDFDRFWEESVDIDKEVNQVLSGLSHAEQTLYHQYYKENMSIKELMELYQVSSTAMKAKLFRLKQHIMKGVQKLQL
ncbi:RNA polymerase sigma factor [Caproicibacter fermentans]|uniref:Sigma-70 family RNA polymerase sigma factor n=1 Tax=Caproicibacter fermentans TaxID=2576756 RepID=A0A7G8TF70_9FIRM|nr:sigma-70 family RNA polymerase sigma factor [Caproicibacter fermentans]QNK42261.1 sigma-70 family RNA polymerase sigma factor [Caproicibacter fermentans]